MALHGWRIYGGQQIRITILEGKVVLLRLDDEGHLIRSAEFPTVEEAEAVSGIIDELASSSGERID